MSRTARLIARSLREKPQDWRYGQTDSPDDHQPRRLIHQSGRQLWTPGGLSWYREHETPKGSHPWPSFGFLDRLVIHRAVLRWMDLYGPPPAVFPPREASRADFGLAD